MKSLKQSTFYFGTTKSAYTEIKERGFSIFYAKTRNFDAWLGDIGVYLSVNRPFIANHFAESKAFWIGTDEKPVVIEAELDFNNIKPTEILDLTCEVGMYTFFRACIECNVEMYGNNKYKESAKLKENDNENYRKDLDDQANNIIENFDCLAITEYCNSNNIKVIIGMFQEGDSIAKILINFSPKHYPKIPSYKGILSRDHIEICVIQPELVSIKRRITEKKLLLSIPYGTKTAKKKYLKMMLAGVTNKRDDNERK